LDLLEKGDTMENLVFPDTLEHQVNLVIMGPLAKMGTQEAQVQRD